ncbi:diacylglycerol kinase catalytic domain protein [Mycobacteroides abscessus subsp. bolletii 1513]|uniref:Diacylglycerol kinase catalytic domain protein n=1 Tax=Mycobacteroides abscessus subsp. bolletii 1513 TaxID=1299321 RepID=X8DHR7_9MYCO|nr:diacylglycerol kinase catalytic domain protein [Mycobacteroides abscessus subsp. bolletii 1513]
MPGCPNSPFTTSLTVPSPPCTTMTAAPSSAARRASSLACPR